MVNKTSHVENCETSAIGRACGVKGIITEYGLASANEVRNAKELEKQLDDLSAVKKVEFTAKPEPTTVPDDLLTKDAPQEMIDNILGKSDKKTINDELISLNARAMKITTIEEGTAISDEYRKMKAAHGEENLPKSLREVVVSSLTAARDKITRDQLA
jgi:hypothetical protein